MANAVLERIVTIDANRRKMSINENQTSILMCMASMENPTRAELFKKMQVDRASMVKSFSLSVKREYITKNGEHKAQNNKTYPRFKLTNLGLVKI